MMVSYNNSANETFGVEDPGVVNPIDPENFFSITVCGSCNIIVKFSVKIITLKERPGERETK